MTISLLNLHAQRPRRLIPICSLRTFQDYWMPGAKSLDLEMVPLFGVLAIGPEHKNTDRIPRLIDELGRLRTWFIQNAPKGEQPFLLASVDRLIKELEAISKEEVIDFTIG